MIYDYRDEPDVEKFAKEELVYIRKYVRDLPHALLIAFSKEFEGKSEHEIKNIQKELLDMYILSTDSSLLNLEISLKGHAELIAKPESYIIDQNGRVVIYTRGETALIGGIEQFGKSRDEIENNLCDWMYLEVTKGNPKIKQPNARIEHVEPLQGFSNEEEARRLLKEYSLKPIEILLLGLGIKPTKETIRLFYPRFLPLFYYDGYPLHVIQLTNTDSGKSHYSVRLEFMLGWTHFTEFPSAAKLIFDGRQGTKGAVFTSQGVAIDEIDKLKKEKFEEAYQPLNTGLENGIWRRGVQSRQGVSLEGYRLIPFLLFGNIVKDETPLYDEFMSNSRQHILQMFESLIGYDPTSFVERFAICDVVPKKIPISKYLIRNEIGTVGILRDSTMRGLIKVIEEHIPMKYVDESNRCIGRLRRHAEGVYNVTFALFDEHPDEDTTKLVVMGDADIGVMLFDEERTTSKQRTESQISLSKIEKTREIEEIEIDMTQYTGGM